MRAHLIDYVLLGFLALLWGSSYLFIKRAVTEIPPFTLIALRVSGACAFLLVVLYCTKQSLPRDLMTWRRLFLQSILNSTAAWTILAWGQQFVPSGLASVLNSTSPIFVIAVLAAFGKAVKLQKRIGALLGLCGVIMVVGPDVLGGLGKQVAGQCACLVGAMLYAGAALYGQRLSHITPLAAAAGTMLCATVVLAPLALIMEQPWTFTPSASALAATAALSLLCTGVALLIYFRLIQTLGPLGTASQSYLRAGIGVLLGIVVLGEAVTPRELMGLAIAILGVAMINWPRKSVG